MNYQTIPVIYLSPFLNGSTGDQQAVARQVGQACEKVGFFTIIGHGVPTQLIQQANKAARLFFDLPLAEKEKVAAVAGMGYLPIESENLAASLDMTQPSDFKESLNLALPVEATSWPQEPAELITVCQAYIQAMESLAATLMQVFALALNLPDDFFAAKIDQAKTILRLLHYPPPADPKPNQMRAAEHTDYGTLTILWSEDSRGLQVRTRQGHWINVISAPEAFIINLGDLMMNWTNDRWLSTPHRVVATPESQQRRRQSIAFFHNPNPNALIECLPGCCDETHPAKYAPILAHEHLNQKIAKALGSTS